MAQYKHSKIELADDYVVFSVNEEYPDANTTEKWIIASNLEKDQLLSLHNHLSKYVPFIAITLEQGLAIYEENCSEEARLRKERRYCSSLDAIVYDGIEYSLLDCDLTALHEKGEMTQLQRAFSMLSDSQKELITALFIHKLGQKEYAALKGISQSAISQQVKTIKSFLKNFLGEPYIST